MNTMPWETKPPITTDMTIIGSHMTKDLQVATLAQHLNFLVINTVIALTHPLKIDYIGIAELKDE
jgi:hypothetical protein